MNSRPGSPGRTRADVGPSSARLIVSAPDVSGTPGGVFSSRRPLAPLFLVTSEAAPLAAGPSLDAKHHEVNRHQAAELTELDRQAVYQSLT